MNSEDMLKLFEEVASVYQSEGAEALTEERISELCKKHDISATELEDLCKNVPCSGEEKISIDDDILENVAGGKMDLKRGAATLLAALSAAGPLPPNASASEPENVRQKITNNAEADHISKKAPDPDTVSRVQNRFGISKKTAKWMVGAAALLSAYPIAKGVKGLISNELSELSGSFNSNKFKNWLKKGGAIRLDDINCNSLEELKSRLRTCNKGKYADKYHNSMLLVCPNSSYNEKSTCFLSCIGDDKDSIEKINSIFKKNPHCSACLYCEKDFMQKEEICKLEEGLTVPVIVVNEQVIADISANSVRYIYGNGWMFDCAPDILQAFNSNGSDQPNGGLPVSGINSQPGTQNDAISPQPAVPLKSPSISQNVSDPLSGGLDSNEFKKHLESYGAIRLDDSKCNSLDDLKNRLSTCNKGKYKDKQYHSMLLVSQGEIDRKSSSFFLVYIGGNKTSIKELNNILKRDLSRVAGSYDEKDFMQNDDICKLLEGGTVPVIVVNENVMDEIVLDPGRKVKFGGDDGKGMFDCASDILDAFNAERDTPKCD